jgi:hypothetical protein
VGKKGIWFSSCLFELLLCSGWGQPSERKENGGIWERGQTDFGIICIVMIIGVMQEMRGRERERERGERERMGKGRE